MRCGHLSANRTRRRPRTRYLMLNSFSGLIKLLIHRHVGSFIFPM
jgi:hypothetical protein